MVEAKKRRYYDEDFNTSVYNDYKTWYDACMFKFIYGIRPLYDKFCWCGISMSREKFARVYIVPLLEYNNYNEVRKWMTNIGVDKLAEYGLISYFFQMKNIGCLDKKQYDINLISIIEKSILRAYREDKKTGISNISLYKLYYYLTKLSDEFFDYRYKYKIRVVDNEKKFFQIDKGNNLYLDNKDSLENFKQSLIKIIHDNKIDVALNIISRNSFSNFRAWLMVYSEIDIDELDDFFGWYLQIHNMLKKRSYPDYEFESVKKGFVNFVEELHSKMFPANKLEYECMVSYKFMKMLCNKKELDEVKENISKYYCCKQPKIEAYISVKNEECKKIIPYNLFREISEQNDSIDISNYNICEKLIYRDDALKCCDIQVSKIESHYTMNRNVVSQTFNNLKEIYMKLNQNIKDIGEEWYASIYYFEKSAKEFDNVRKVLITNIADELNKNLEYVNSRYIQVHNTMRINIYRCVQLFSILKDIEYLDDEATKVSGWINSIKTNIVINEVNNKKKEIRLELILRLKYSLIFICICIGLMIIFRLLI